MQFPFLSTCCSAREQFMAILLSAMPCRHLCMYLNINFSQRRRNKRDRRRSEPRMARYRWHIKSYAPFQCITRYLKIADRHNRLCRSFLIYMWKMFKRDFYIEGYYFADLIAVDINWLICPPLNCKHSKLSSLSLNGILISRLPLTKIDTLHFWQEVYSKYMLYLFDFILLSLHITSIHRGKCKS